MKNMKWYVKAWIVLLIIVCSPFIILLALIAVPLILVERAKAKKAYYKSPYYAAFKKKFAMGITSDPAYRCYNGVAARGLPVKFGAKLNGPLYCIHEGTLYVFPDFEQMGLSEDDGTTWQVNYDGDWVDFEEAYAKILAKSMDSYKPIKLLVERSMITEYDLNKVELPPCVFVTGSYDTAFENEDSPLKMMVPQNAEELYAMMQKTPDLCGEYELTENRDGICWRIREDIQITLGVDPRDCYIGVDKLLFGKIESGITHWHPTACEIYNEVREIGKRGNVLVLRSIAGSGAVLYGGKKEDCPYKPDKKVLFGKYYYIEAK
ncbi:MAG: hypothetical protein E7645_00010 [Ruminococcaceae bacterium]|nr:hypothetical protein [Oscillospiraceae bacterium]